MQNYWDIYIHPIKGFHTDRKLSANYGLNRPKTIVI